MLITNETLADYVGGQMEIQNSGEEYLYRGELEEIAVVNGDLVAKFSWIAKGIGYPPLPEKWVNDPLRDYAASLELFSPVDVGEDRICLTSPATGETLVIYPPTGSKLDPAKVEGLSL